MARNCCTTSGDKRMVMRSLTNAALGRPRSLACSDAGNDAMGLNRAGSTLDRSATSPSTSITGKRETMFCSFFSSQSDFRSAAGQCGGDGLSATATCQAAAPNSQRLFFIINVHIAKGKRVREPKVKESWRYASRCRRCGRPARCGCGRQSAGPRESRTRRRREAPAAPDRRR